VRQSLSELCAKLTKQEPSLIWYIVNEDDQAAAVRFKFLIYIQNWETILVKMMRKFSKSVKKYRDSTIFVISMLNSILLYTQKTVLSLFLADFNNLHFMLMIIVSQFESLFEIKIRPLQLDQTLLQIF
jgi:hypothetical protein